MIQEITDELWAQSVPSFTRCATQQAEGIEICQLDLEDAVGVVTRRGCGKYCAQNPRCG